MVICSLYTPIWTSWILYLIKLFKLESNYIFLGRIFYNVFLYLGKELTCKIIIVNSYWKCLAQKLYFCNFFRKGMILFSAFYIFIYRLKQVLCWKINYSLKLVCFNNYLLFFYITWDQSKPGLVFFSLDYSLCL